jgi:hypothetical protein
MCYVLLPPGVNPIAVIYIYIYIISSSNRLMYLSDTRGNRPRCSAANTMFTAIAQRSLGPDKQYSLLVPHYKFARSSLTCRWAAAGPPVRRRTHLLPLAASLRLTVATVAGNVPRQPIQYRFLNKAVSVFLLNSNVNWRRCGLTRLWADAKL